MTFQTHIPPPGPVAVAMSGGVDSSLAAVLLKEEGYDVIGLTMRVRDATDEGRVPCCSPKTFSDARDVCHQWGIPHYLVDVRKAFEERVIRSFIEEYLAGRTPNPCVVCNTQIKWDLLMHRALTLGARALATGHYARVLWDPGRNRYLLLRGLDRAKDQSYALWGLSQENLSTTVLPLGGMTKTQVRDLARRLGLKVAEKPDSQEICFVPGDDYGLFIKNSVIQNMGSDRLPWSPGPMVDRQGRVLGQHRGMPFYTVGQRRGLSLASGRPLYVLDVDGQHNRLVVGAAEELLTRHLWAGRLNWVSISPPAGPFRCEAQIRYHHRAAPATLCPLPDDVVRLDFDRSQRAVTPGQSAVFYGGEEVLGGGIINRSPNQEVLPSVEAESSVGKEKTF